jgi:hypothetical protein
MTSMNPDILSTFSGAKTIGRYFTVVSFLPSVPFVAYALLLQKSGAWNGAVSMGQAVAGPDATDASVLAVGSLAPAMALHPLQFALVQFFEGYWGSSRAATYIATSRIQRHRRRQSKLTDEAWRLGTSSRHTPDVRRRASIASAPRGAVAELVRSSESGRQTTFYPAELEMIMPTMLGDVLRRYELEAGRAYGLNCLTVLPRIMQRADQRDIDYVQNQRTQLDLAVRTATPSLAATGLTVAYMWSHGLWLLLTLIPSGLAFASRHHGVRTRTPTRFPRLVIAHDGRGSSSGAGPRDGPGRIPSRGSAAPAFTAVDRSSSQVIGSCAGTADSGAGRGWSVSRLCFRGRGSGARPRRRCGRRPCRRRDRGR